MSSRRPNPIVFLMLALLGCSRTHDPARGENPDATPAAAAPGPARDGSTPDVAAPTGAHDGGSATMEIATAPVATAVASMGPDREIALARDAVTLVEPSAAFRVEVAAAIADGRLSLRDDQDAMVPSRGTTEVTPQRTRYHLVPDTPLQPGTSYTLHLDGATTRDAHDSAGRTYRPVAFSLRTTGERPSPPPRKRSRGRR